MNKWSEERAKLASALARLRNNPPVGIGRLEWNKELIKQARSIAKR